jgi:hypothetical protein
LRSLTERTGERCTCSRLFDRLADRLDQRQRERRRKSASNGHIGEWKPTKPELELLNKASKEAFDYMCDGHRYRFDDEVLDAVHTAIGTAGTFLDAIRSLTESLPDDWSHGSAKYIEPGASPQPDWWGAVTVDERLYDGELVYSLDSKEDE